MQEGNAAPSLGGSSSSAEQLASETSPCERGRNKCSCCKKRKFDNDWTCDIIKGCMGEVVEAIGEFREVYQAIECTKTDVLEKIAKMNKEKEERLQRFTVEQQVVMAKMNKEKEERLQKFMVEQQVVMAKLIAEAVKEAVDQRLNSPAE